jgi:hypothetical protein
MDSPPPHMKKKEISFQVWLRRHDDHNAHDEAFT